MARPKVDGSWTYGFWAWVEDHQTAELAAKEAARAALERTRADDREPVQIEVTVRLAPKGKHG